MEEFKFLRLSGGKDCNNTVRLGLERCYGLSADRKWWSSSHIHWTLMLWRDNRRSRRWRLAWSRENHALETSTEVVDERLIGLLCGMTPGDADTDHPVVDRLQEVYPHLDGFFALWAVAGWFPGV